MVKICRTITINHYIFLLLIKGCQNQEKIKSKKYHVHFMVQ